MSIFYLALPVVGVSTYLLVKNLFYAAPPDATVKRPSESVDVQDHPPGNVQPLKTTNVFKSIKYFIGGPYDPVNSPLIYQGHDIYNMPYQDYPTPTGARVRTYGYVEHGRTSRPGFPVFVLPGTPLGSAGATEPVMTRRPEKNLRRHPTLMESQYVR